MPNITYKLHIEKLLSSYGLPGWVDCDGFLNYLYSLPDFLCKLEDFTQAYYDFQMEEFDYHMWLHDFCYLTHVSNSGPTFIYTNEGKFLRGQYAEEIINDVTKIF